MADPRDTGGADDTAAPQSPEELRSGCRLFRVSGRVQGVFFRASTQTAARDLGLSGYARNLDDGSVEVLACGSAAALDRLQQWLREGPPMAVVESVSGRDVAWRDLETFETG